MAADAGPRGSPVHSRARAYEQAETPYRAARAKRDSEDAEAAAIKEGRSDRSWIDEALRQRVARTSDRSRIA